MSRLVARGLAVLTEALGGGVSPPRLGARWVLTEALDLEPESLSPWEWGNLDQWFHMKYEGRGVAI